MRNSLRLLFCRRWKDGSSWILYMAFHFRQNSVFHFTLCFTQSILHFVFAIWVCARDSTFLHSTFNFDSCNIQVFAFDFQLFISTSQVFEFDLQVQWNVHSFFLHPTFSICPLSFRFRHPTLGIVLASFRIRHSSFGIGLLPAGQRPIEIVGSTDLTHPRSNGGRESIDRLPSGVDSEDLLHSWQTRRITDRTWPWGCTVFEGGECCTTECLL